MNFMVESYTVRNLTQNELDLIYVALCHFPDDNPRCYDAFLLKEKIRLYQSTVLANRERDSDGREND